MSQTTETLNFCSANGFPLAQTLIGLVSMHLNNYYVDEIRTTESLVTN